MAERANAATIHTLLETDPSVVSIEVGHFGTIFDCTIRRRRAVHVIRGQGATPAAAFRAAAIEYLGAGHGDPIEAK